MQSAIDTGITSCWDENARLLRLSCTRDANLSGDAAERILAQLEPLVASGPVRILVRAQNAGHATLLWALQWTDFLRKHRNQIRVAVYDIPRKLEPLVSSVSWSTNGILAGFASEAEARAWLSRASSPS